MVGMRRNGGRWGSKFEIENKINRRCKVKKDRILLPRNIIKNNSKLLMLFRISFSSIWEEKVNCENCKNLSDLSSSMKHSKTKSLLFYEDRSITFILFNFTF